MSDDGWTEAEVQALHQQIIGELMNLFGHGETVALTLLTDWLAYNPDFSPDEISHQGPSNMALRIHYAMVERGDPTSVAFREWRRQYDSLWEDRRKPKLSPRQEALLRERGWNGS